MKFDLIELVYQGVGMEKMLSEHLETRPES